MSELHACRGFQDSILRAAFIARGHSGGGYCSLAGMAAVQQIHSRVRQ